MYTHNNEIPLFCLHYIIKVELKTKSIEIVQYIFKLI